MLSGVLAALGLPASALVLALARAGSVGALFVGFGTLLVRVVIARPVLARADAAGGAARRRLAWMLGAALAVAAAATLAWLASETAALADPDDWSATLAMIPTVLTGTEFGTLIAVRLALLVLIALAAVAGRSAIATALAAVAVVLQAGHLHAFAMVRGPSVLLASEVVHVFAAAAWLGALPGLLVVVATLPAEPAGRAAARFSPVGRAAVLAIAASAAWQARMLVGTLAGLLGTPYGWICLAKLALFIALLALAAENRFALVPRLARDRTAPAHLALLRGIACELVLGVAVVMLAALLGSGVTPPPVDVPPAAATHAT
ncbi:MAG: CopD family protein [Alphaproteobacteria bacterium]|nr:CopD family protein [Alphaproteobacteria bacterium]